MSVSIVIPTYNNSSTIKDCILSAVNQKYSKFDIIVSDNNSTDNTFEIVKNLKLKYQNIKLYKNNKNIGPVHNWKKAIDLSNSKYVKILFSDDMIDPEYLNKTINKINDKTSFSITAQKIGPNLNNYFIHSDFGSYKGYLDKKKYLKKAIFSFAFCVSPCAALFRRKDLIKHFEFEIASPILTNFADHGAGPDLNLFLKIARDYPYVYIEPQPLVFFRSHLKSNTIIMKKYQNELITRSYEQTRFNFVLNYLNKNLFSSFIARVYLIEILKLKNLKFINPQNIFRQYGDGYKINFFYFLFGIFYTIYMIIFYFYFNNIKANNNK